MNLMLASQHDNGSVPATQLLLEPYSLGDLPLRNRIVMAPLTRTRSTLPGQVPNDLMQEYYRQRASAGLILTEGTFVSEDGRGWFGVPGIYNAQQGEGWRKITDAVHAEGGRIFAQLWHQGSVSLPELLSEGHVPLGPSSVNPEQPVYVRYRETRMSGVPRAMTIDDIRKTIDDFRQAARIAQDAGFDGVQIQGGFVYLFQQFLQDNLNLRTDEYGGTIENRARLLFEVLEAVLEVWPSQRVGVKAGPMMPERGLLRATDTTLATSEYVYRRLNDYNLSHVLLMRQQASLTGTPIEALEGDGVIRHFRGLYSGSLILNVGLTARHGEELLQQGLGELVAFGRDFIANPDLVERIRRRAPLNEQRPEGYYGNSAAGYTDYPTLHVKDAVELTSRPMPEATNVGTIQFFRERQRVETPLTTNVFQALPSDKLAYRPHPNSQTAATAAWTIVRCLAACEELARKGVAELQHDEPPSHAEIVDQYVKLSASVADQLSTMDQQQWEEIATLTVTRTPILKKPLGEILWLFFFDAIHHRGQLSTYLRPLGARVPSIYGKSG
ncbi:MAG TPA: DinB family protein, partial [Acidobacteriaceae bacterium]